MMKKALMMVLLFFRGLEGDDFFKVKQDIQEWPYCVAGIYLRPSLVLRNLGYTTNIYTYSRFDSPDWVAEPGAELRLAAVVRDRLIVSAFAQPYFSFFLNHADNRAWSGRWGASLYTHLGRFNLRGTYFQSSQQTLPSPEFTRPFRYYDYGYNAILDWGRQESFYIRLEAEHQEVTYGKGSYLEEYNPSRLLDHRAERLGISFSTVIFTRTMLYVEGKYERYRFLHMPQRDADSQKYLLGVRFPEVGAFIGSFSLGLRVSNPHEEAYASSRNLVGEGDLTIQLLRHLKLKVGYLFDRSYSIFGDLLYYNLRQANAGFDLYLTGRIKIGGLYRFNALHYHSLLDTADLRLDRYSLRSLILGIRISGKWTLNLYYNIYAGESTQAGFERDYTFIGGSIVNEF